MMYRIRYRRRDVDDQVLLVEANSPNEAMVKFQCSSDREGWGAHVRQEVLSVAPDLLEEAAAW
jgi:hypothetical protein